VDRIVAGIEAANRRQSPDDGGAPVVISTVPAVGRFAFPVVDRSRWIAVPPERLTEYAQRVHDLGVGPITFVSRDPSSDLQKLDGLYTVRDKMEPSTGWTVATLDPCPSPNSCPAE